MSRYGWPTSPVRAVAMFVLESEAPTVAEVFAVKFGDIARRCRVLFGQFPSGLSGISREAKTLAVAGNS